MEHHLQYGKFGGTCRAECSCGVKSEVLTSRQQRREWFWKHREYAKSTPQAVLRQLSDLGQQRYQLELDYKEAIAKGARIGLTNQKMADAVGGVTGAAIRMYRKRHDIG